MQALGTSHITPSQARATAVGPSRFHIAEEAQEGQRVLFLHGELDVAAAPVLRARATELALQDGVVNIDLSGVEFVDVAGLCALNSLAREARRGRWYLDLRHAPISVRQLARLTGMRNLTFAA
jgi:anti-anti-sigma factor